MLFCLMPTQENFLRFKLKGYIYLGGANHSIKSPSALTHGPGAWSTSG